MTMQQLAELAVIVTGAAHTLDKLAGWLQAFVGRPAAAPVAALAPDIEADPAA